MKRFRISIAQLNSSENIEENFKVIKRFIYKAAHNKSNLIVFPEAFLYRGSKKRHKEISAYIESKIIPELSQIAEDTEINILCGTIIETSPVKNKYYSTSFMIDRKGVIIGKYRKIHLFDVNLSGSKASDSRLISKESEYVLPGKKISVLDVDRIKMGIGICYDLRFPEFFRRLVDKGAEVILLPSNFTRFTGRAHWKTLVRARAIENQVFMACPNQWGKNPKTGKESYGHSMIVDPWGNIIAEAGLKQNRLLTSEIDFISQRKIRQEMPCLNPFVAIGMKNRDGKDAI